MDIDRPLSPPLRLLPPDRGDRPPNATLRRGPTFVAGQPTTPTSPVAPPQTALPTEPVAAAPPSAARRLANFTVAAIAHLVHGMPTCTQDEIDRRLGICEACPYFNGQICTHASCGCNVNGEVEFLHKLAWADQRCSVGKWCCASIAGLKCAMTIWDGCTKL